MLGMLQPWEEESLLSEHSPKRKSLAWALGRLPILAVAFYHKTNPVTTSVKLLCSFIKCDYSVRLSQTQVDTPCRFLDEKFTQILESCRNPLRRFESLDGVYRRDLTRPALRRYFNALKVLCAAMTMAPTSFKMEGVSSSCPQLIEFRHASALNTSDVVKNIALDKENSTFFLAQLWLYKNTFSSSVVPTVLPKLLPSHSPFAWVCRRLQVLNIELLEHSNDWWMSAEVSAQLTQLKELRELHLCSPDNESCFGLDPRMYLDDI
ncbi:hypothetical protein BGZ46_002167, partial [Entomortierella lignicola]